MKQVKIVIKVDEVTHQVATAKETEGFGTDNVEDQYELLGILEMLKQKQMEKINEVTKVKRFKN
jgi:hypothetical protein